MTIATGRSKSTWTAWSTWTASSGQRAKWFRVATMHEPTRWIAMCRATSRMIVIVKGRDRRERIGGLRSHDLQGQHDCFVNHVTESLKAGGDARRSGKCPRHRHIPSNSLQIVGQGLGPLRIRLIGRDSHMAHGDPLSGRACAVFAHVTTPPAETRCMTARCRSSCGCGGTLPTPAMWSGTRCRPGRPLLAVVDVMALSLGSEFAGDRIGAELDHPGERGVGQEAAQFGLEFGFGLFA